MAPDSHAFRRTLGQFATGVTVIAAEVDGEVHGMTANSFTSLSLDPMLVLFCVGKHSRTAAIMQKVDGFSVNILTEDQQALATFFAGSWQEPAPPAFRFVAWTGGPRLEGCAAIGCAVHQIVDGGDHLILIGRVVALHQELESLRPLLFFDGHYQRLKSGDGGWQAGDPVEPSETTLGPWGE